jgi:hypothetical protein
VQNPWWIALAAGLLSGSFSALATYTLNHNRDSNDLRREKAEEFYLAIDTYTSFLKIGFLHDISVGKKSSLPLNEDQMEQMTKAYSIINMSSMIHFTMLRNRVEALFLAKENVSKRIFYKYDSDEKRREEVKTSLRLLESCADDLKMHVARSARHGSPLSLAESAGQLLGLRK